MVLYLLFQLHAATSFAGPCANFFENLKAGARRIRPKGEPTIKYEMSGIELQAIQSEALKMSLRFGISSESLSASKKALLQRLGNRFYGLEREQITLLPLYHAIAHLPPERLTQIVRAGATAFRMEPQMVREFLTQDTLENRTVSTDEEMNFFDLVDALRSLRQNGFQKEADEVSAKILKEALK